MKTVSRRNFLTTTALAGTGTLLGTLMTAPLQTPSLVEQNDLEVHLFSKHLQFLEYEAMAAAAAEMGFDGVDLSVRPKGHVLPERVAQDLPRAIEAIKKAGLAPKLMTTSITAATETHTKLLLTTAADLGIEYYRLGYYKFPEEGSIPEAIAAIRKKVNTLAKLNKKLGIKGAYQNHSGRQVGAAIWDIHEMLKKVKNDHLGCQYDIRHATVEGGESWRTGLRLIDPWINTIVLKDFRWEKINGKWKVLNVPIGEGMVDFTAYFKWLKAHQIKVPVSLHCEYDLGGAEHGNREISISHQAVFAAMKKDLEAIQELWGKA